MAIPEVVGPNHVALWKFSHHGEIENEFGLGDNLIEV